MIAECSAPDKTMTSMYALGWTQHSKGSQNIRTMAMIQLHPRQHRRARRRHERAARSLQHPGPDRHRPDVEPDPGLSRRCRPRREADVRRPTCRAAASSRCGPDQMSYWQNYKKFFVSFLKAMYGDGGDAGERLRLRLSAEARRARLRRAARLRADAPGQDERLLLPGLQPAAVVPEPEEDHGRAVEAQVPGRHGSARDRDGAVLGEPRRVQRRRSDDDPDRGLPAADDLLRRGRRLADQFQPLAAMALGRRRRLRARPRPTSGSWRSSTCG